MAEKFVETPQSVSRDDAILRVIAELSESVKKMDERLQKLEQRSQLDVGFGFQQGEVSRTRLSSSGRQEVQELLSEEDNLVQRRLADEMRNESTGLGAGDSSQSADEDDPYPRVSQDVRDQRRGLNLGRENCVFQKSPPTTKLSSFKRHEVQGRLLKEDN